MKTTEKDIKSQEAQLQVIRDETKELLIKLEDKNIDVKTRLEYSKKIKHTMSKINNLLEAMA